MSRQEGSIWKALSGFYYVRTADGASLRCTARGKFRLDQANRPLVGDRVSVSVLADGSGVVEEILPRTNLFSRPAVANIDQLVIVASGAVPRTDPYLIDRMTAIAALKQCRVLVCLNKCDLDPAEELYTAYTLAGIPVLRVSALSGEGVETLRERLSGTISAFTGNSGVGKSSLLNALDPRYSITVGEVSQALGRGKHTTRHIELYPLDDNTGVMDTPGFSSFDSEELDIQLKKQLSLVFSDFAPYQGLCRFEDCRHIREKGCAVLEAVQQGKIARSRHASYLRLQEELKGINEWD